ncbi:MAG: hypothetical protein U0176_11305 [Bacteroidia bacterium]
MDSAFSSEISSGFASCTGSAMGADCVMGLFRTSKPVKSPFIAL